MDFIFIDDMRVEAHVGIFEREKAAPQTLEMNDIARVRLKMQKPMAFDLYEENRVTGAFVVIDERSNRTVAAGTIR